MIKITLFGASGRMGRGLVRLIRDDDEVELVAAVVGPKSNAVGVDAGVLAGGSEIGVLCGTELKSPDVVIDFSTPGAMRLALERCVAEGLSLVSGTTGIGSEDQQALDEAARSIPVLWAANMSLGMQLAYELVRRSAAAIGDRADIEIVEAHHRGKKDAPSGTALALGRAAAAGAGIELDAAQVLGRAGAEVPRKAGEIGFSAIRGGDIIGEHTVLFAMDGERLEITHRATDRSVFLRGAIAAAKFLARQQPGRYELRDVLGGGSS